MLTLTLKFYRSKICFSHTHPTNISVYPQCVAQMIFQTSLLLPGLNAILSTTTFLLTTVIFSATTVSHLVHSTALLTPKSPTGLLLCWSPVSMCIPTEWLFTGKKLSLIIGEGCSFVFWRKDNDFNFF